MKLASGILVLVSACSSGGKPEEAPARTAPEVIVAHDSGPPVSAVRTDPGRLEDVSTDGKRALLYADHDATYRVVAIASNQVEREVSLSTLDAGFVARDPQHTGVLRAAAELVASFPRRSTGRVAASTDGKQAAFVTGAGELTIVRGSTSKLPAPLFATFAPDGNTLFVQREVATSERTGPVWELQAVTGEGTPRSLGATRGVHAAHVATPADLRVMLSPDPLGDSCFVAVAWSAPHAVKRLGCVPGGERLLGCVLSRSGTWAACSTLAKDAQPRTRTVHLETGTPGIDVRGPATRFAISDDGTLVRYDPTAKQLVITDPSGVERAMIPHDHDGSEGMFRDARELVVLQRGKLVVIDVKR